MSKRIQSPILALLAALAATAPLLAQTPTLSAVVNAASYSTTIAPGSWVALTGTNLSTTTRSWSSSDIVGGVLPKVLDGVSVTINGKSAAIYYVSPTQVNVLAPSDTTTGSVSVVLTNSAGSATTKATLASTSPAFFASSKGGKSYVVAENTSYSVVSRSVPVASGDTVVLFATGLGATNPAVDPASDYSGAAPLADLSSLSLTVGGKSATVSWAGLIGNGLYQINAVLPAAVSDGDATVTAAVSGKATNSVYLPVSATRKQITAKVACLGDSITAITTYPTTLQSQLGSNYTVTNYGVPGSTVILTSGRSYYSQAQYTSAKQALPDIVVLMLGTNDTSSSVYSSISTFQTDYKKMIAELRALDSHPQVWLVKPPPIYTNTIGVSNENLVAGVLPGIVQVASDLGLTAIDANTPLSNHSEYFSDGVHPNSTGAAILATQVGTAIQ
jgi:uncharacterized protein (TIGR03437 family)